MLLPCLIVFLKEKELWWAGLGKICNRSRSQAENYLSMRATNQSQIYKKMYQFSIIKHLLDRASLDIDFDFLCRLTLMSMSDSTRDSTSSFIKHQPKYAQQIEGHTRQCPICVVKFFKGSPQPRQNRPAQS